MTSFTKTYLLLVAMVLISLSSPVVAQNKENGDIWIPLIDSPSGELVYFKPDSSRRPQPDPSWSLRTGIKKGIIGLTLEQEQFAGPDAAVLKNGFFEPWTGLLSEFREPAVLADANRIAGLEKTKPYLIIPSGALHGFSKSEFFKAGLAEYARSGGVIICFAQQNGADFTALPVPAGSKIEALGWLQDPGPLFRASSVQNRHPMLAGTRKTVPDLETSGYLTTFPDDAKVVLSRSDGFPTLIVYPLGSGWVVVTTLFTDYSFDQGQLNQEEKNLVRDLLLWAKAPAQVVDAAPGEQLRFPLSLQGSELGEASSIKLMIMGSDSDKPISEETVPAQVKPNQVKELDFPYTVPVGMLPGLYHLEYILFNAEGKALSIRAESKAGRFSVGQPAVAAPILRQQPLSGVTVPFSVHPSLERVRSAFRLNLDIVRDQKTPADANQPFLIRAAGQEKSFALGADRQTLSFDLPETEGQTVSFIVSHKSGRSLLRGAVPLSIAPGKNVVLAKPSYLPGQNAVLAMTGLGSGDFVLMAPGHIASQMITGKGEASYPVPVFLPAGTYQLLWNMTTLEGSTTRGEMPVNIAGCRVRVQDEALEYKVDRGATTAFVRFRVHATHKLDVRMKLELHGPDGTTMPAAEGPIALSEGIQEVPFTFSFKPEAAGVWELRYSLETRLPDGPGIPAEPVILAAGQTLFDAGAVALLGAGTDRLVYHDASDPVELSAYLSGKGKAKFEIFLDTVRIRKERLDLAGPHTYMTSLPGMKPGVHILKATVMNEAFTSTVKHSFLSGTRFPDLIAELQVPEPAGIAMPVSIKVKNQGKLASDPSIAALYEGDPSAGGSLIARVDVPSLGPEALHQTVIDWSLMKKAGNRKLFVVADQNNVVTESSENNNKASVETTIPDLLLFVRPEKSSFSANESIAFSLYTANLSTTTCENLRLRVELVDAPGKSLSSEVIPLTEFAPGVERKYSRNLALSSLPQGTYRINAQFEPGGPHAPVSSVITILPTLMLQGSLQGTPSSAALCMPFTLRHTIKNSGNLPASTGAVRLEITSSDTGKQVYARQLPLSLEPAQILIENNDFPEGQYVLSLKATASNQSLPISRDFLLAEQGLAITAPISVTRGISKIPRVLLWLGKNGTSVQQAVAVKIVQQAFDDSGAYFTIVDKEEDFTNQAMSGLFNTYVLFETDELIGQTGWLRDRVKEGQGLVIIGSDDRTRALAEDFGFAFSETTAESGSLLLFTENTGSALSGTMPISGPMLVPRKPGAKPTALFAGDGKPAALIDATVNGQVLVMPFSLSRSAVDMGATSLYSLLLRTAVGSVAPKTADQAGIFMEELTVSANAGMVKARIVVTMPKEARNVWASGEGAVKNNVATYALTASHESQKLLYLYQAPVGGGKQPGVAVYYKCGGTFLLQGKVE